MVRVILNKAPLEKLIESIPHLVRKMAENVAVAWEKEVRENFAEWGRPPWPPLSPKTIEEKLALGYPLDPLIRTYTMYNSFEFRVEPKTPRIAHVVGENKVFYAKFHEFGTDRVPARPFLSPELPANKAGIVKAIIDAFKGVIK